MIGLSQKLQAASELRRAIQQLLSTLDPDTQAEKLLEVPSVFPVYAVGTSYRTKEVFRYGENSVGDPQLYQVLQDHTSTAEWTPDAATSLYKKIGVSADGTPEWVQPLGATDAYNIGDIVIHKEKKWISTINSNVWEPGVYGWDEYLE